MARPPAPELPWLTEAIQLMVRNGLSLRQAANDLNIAVTTVDLENIQRRRSFQALLRSERSRYYQELGSDPSLTKECVIGKLLLLADKLYEQGDYDKSGEILFKIEKIRGHVGSDQAVNIFHGLSAKELEEARRRLVERNELDSRTAPVN
jgi:hypothetical protein